MKTLWHITVLIVLSMGMGSFSLAGVVITPADGFQVEWNGNDGDLEGEVPDNFALEPNGGGAFSSGDLGPQLGIAFHVAANINDGVYGNSNSWIGADAGVAPFHVGVDLGASRAFRAVAWGRDNAAGFGDRALGVYELQITDDASPGPESAWTTIATFDYQGNDDAARGGLFTSSLRHEYTLATDADDPVTATGVRLVVPTTGLAGGVSVDELEVLAEPISEPPPPPPPPLIIESAEGFDISWDGNDGDRFDAAPPPDGALAAENLALESSGGVAFSSGDLGPQLGVPFHVAGNINDGFYGNSNAWIGSDDALDPPHVGVNLGGLREISSIAWGRDNGNGAFDGSDAGTDACGGQCVDRSVGVYTIQISRDDSPGSGSEWITVGTVDHQRSDDMIPGEEFTSFFRHEFSVMENGEAVLATGVRLLVPVTGIAGGTAIDELEVFGESPPPPNNAPVAAIVTDPDPADLEIGADGTAEIMLDGNGSDDGDGGAQGLTYLWEKVSGPDGDTIESAAEAITRVTFSAEGEYVYRLTVDDGQAENNTASAEATVLVTHSDIFLLRGDVDGSGLVDITDGIFIFNFLFLGGSAPSCPDAADTNDEGAVSITSGIYILNFLFIGGPAPPEPYPACGADASDDSLGDCDYPNELCP